MTLKHLQIFCVVCDEMNMTHAAEKLYMTQPAVSRVVSDLEKRYQVKLFDRINHKLYLTDDGRKFLAASRNVLLEMERLENSVQSHNISKELHVGCSLGIGINSMEQHLDTYYKKYPDTKIYVTENHSTAIENLVLENRLDFGIIEGTVHSNSLVDIPFLTDKTVAVCSPKHPMANLNRIASIADLNETDLYLPEDGTGTRDLLNRHAAQFGIVLSPVWSTINFLNILKAVEAGRGITILSRYLVESKLQSGELVEIETDFSIQRTFHVIRHENKYLPINAGYFISLW